MKKGTFMSVAAVVFAAILFTGCAKMPQAEIDAANMSVEEAKSAGAELYAQDSFIALQDSMKAAMESIETQQSKLFKNYDEAKLKLAAIPQLSQTVKGLVDAKKEEMKKEITATIDTVKSLLAENNDLVTKAPKGKEGATALIEIKSELATIEASVAEATTLAENDNLINSLNKVKAANERASSINEELKNVIAKSKGKR